MARQSLNGKVVRKKTGKKDDFRLDDLFSAGLTKGKKK